MSHEVYRSWGACTIAYLNFLQTCTMMGSCMVKEKTANNGEPGDLPPPEGFVMLGGTTGYPQDQKHQTHKEASCDVDLVQHWHLVQGTGDLEGQREVGVQGGRVLLYHRAGSDKLMDVEQTTTEGPSQIGREFKTALSSWLVEADMSGGPCRDKLM
ncbi:hypothetical protein BKA82DRAFT_4019460 [Pisolithus tinctorius]|nr:hypothetical protein BKA82DRAFT_4019460 [Pisolithus tinctorius]